MYNQCARCSSTDINPPDNGWQRCNNCKYQNMVCKNCNAEGVEINVFTGVCNKCE